MKNSIIGIFVALLVVGSLSISLAKGGGGYRERDPYEWEPKTPEEKVVEYIRVDRDITSLVSIYDISEEVKKMEEIPPEILEKLSAYSQKLLGAFLKTEEMGLAENIVEALTLFKERGVKDIPDIDKLLRQRYVSIGRELIKSVKGYCKSTERRGVNSEFDLQNINKILKTGISLEEIGVPSVEAMRDLAACE